ncbi:putative hydrolase [Selenomonas ruminantium subsp. lactilytica TAM6421]|uniref:Putative hydrolase n=1 Tax=Selenomonas ruminantium subsp. lactilytica (strain NBRC 103574 / TAM6421) TaxID=927704 RepID=I0GSF3_SELRL|nr:Cof-type HAD-IIB family hydrolase [Selenomonas ruminantium]BAL83690.1 putative hydrolase [Selenomonas ruminantium subsp. lactilytica TAM6421]
MTKAVFFDIDGTLINIHHKRTSISPMVKRAIHELRAAGHRTFIASGRPWAYLSAEMTSEGLFDGFVLMNGAVVILDGQVIFRQDMPAQTVREMVALAEEKGLEYILEGHPKVYLRPEFKGLENVYRNIKIDVDEFVRDFDLEDVQAAKLEFLCDTPGADGAFEKLLSWPGVTGLIDPTLRKYMELYAADISKATGIQWALEYMKVPLENSYAFGDGLNDLEMMGTVGHALVMGNAGPELKSLAEHVLPTVDEDGVAEGIYRYILKRI